jgi:hypothetical protein
LQFVGANHAFPKAGSTLDRFTALCLRNFAAINGEDKQEEYCSFCFEKATIAEMIAQSKEDERINRLNQKQPNLIKDINAILTAMSTDDLMSLHA